MTDQSWPRNVTINDMPEEIIELFAPDQRPDTISTLRLVSRRFREVFGADRFYRCYLRYPHTCEIYRSDLADIGNVKNKWKRCLEVEKRRMANWKNGQPASVHVAEVPAELSFRKNSIYWQHSLGKEREHWMLTECMEIKIVLLNATSKPIMSVIDVNSYTSLKSDYAQLAPGQVLFRNCNGPDVVTNIINNGTNLYLEKFFEIEKEGRNKFCFISGYSKDRHTYRSWCGYYKGQQTDGVLKLWDLKKAVEIGPIVLSDLMLPQHRLGQLVKLKAVKAKFPYVAICLQFENGASKMDILSAVDVEERRIVLWEEDDKAFVQTRRWAIEENFLIIEFKDQSIGARFYTLSEQCCMSGTTSYLYGYSAVTEVACYVRGYLEPPKLILIHGALSQNLFLLEYYDGSKVPARQIVLEDALEKYEKKFRFRHLIGPIMAIERRRKAEPFSYHLLAVDLSGNELFDWGTMLKIGGSACLEDLSFVFPSLAKSILRNRRGNKIFICKF